MAIIDNPIGAIGYPWKYTYDSTKTYASRHIVSDGYSTFVSIKDNNVGNPLPTNAEEEAASEWWKYFANGQVAKDAAATANKATEDNNAAEAKRVKAEEARVQQEGVRVQNEASRQTAEAKRESDSATAVSNANSAAKAANEAAETIDTKIAETADFTEKLQRDLAQYDEATPLTLSLGQSGKYIDTTGVVKSNSAYAISAQVELQKGNIYLVKPSTAIATGVALCAEYTTEEKDVVIEYTYTYDTDGTTILKATADYDTSLVYTYNYDTDSEGNKTLKNITASGNIVDYLPQYRTVAAGSYVPLFKNLSTTAPKSGYYAVLANETCKAVFSLPTADITSTVIVASYGIFRSIINNKEDKAVVKKLQEQVTDLQKQIEAMSEQSLAVGFSRMNGSADPAPASEDCFGKKSYIHDIGSHLHLGTFVNGVLQRTAKAGRLTVGVDGDKIVIDGTEGDVMLYFDCPVELLKARAEVSGVDTNVCGLSLTKAAWQGKVSKTLDKFAVTPDETVHCQLDGDTRSQAHSIYNTSAIGTYQNKQTMFAETFRASGAGVPTHYVSGLVAIQQAQNKNSDALTNRPYMGFYYEFYEAILALMFAECQTLYVNAPLMFGCGCTTTHGINASTFFDENMTGNSGVKWLDADGNAAYTSLMTQVLVGESQAKTYCLDGLVGNLHYTCAEMLEPQRILDAIAEAGLISYIGNSSAIFSYDDEGNMAVTTDGSIDPSTGDGMTANKKYFVVRNVPNCEGMADGVMTAVINVYFLMNTDESTTVCISTSDTTARTKAIFKFSFPIYRGFTLPLCGAFRQTQGMYYVYGKDADGNDQLRFMCASNVDNLPALTAFNSAAIYGDIGTDFEVLKGLDISNDRASLQSEYSWCKSADYGNSLFDAIAKGGGISSYEGMFRWLLNCQGVSTGKPENGKECVCASAVGCAAVLGLGSVRSALCDYALSAGSGHFAGAFAIPHIALTKATE